jgi:phosphate uptake regulator
MSDPYGTESEDAGPATAVQQRLAAMGSMVESLFAECIVALIDESPDLVSDMRTEDTRAHEECIRIDKLCVELLCTTDPDPGAVRSALGAVKIAGALKRIADDAVRIAEASQAWGHDNVGVARSLSSLPRMAELIQGMLGDAVDGLIRRRAEASAGLHLVLGEVRDAGQVLAGRLADGVGKGNVTPEASGAFCVMAQHLERIGGEVLEVANQTRYLQPADTDL